MDMKEIVAILMRRDGLTENEAWLAVERVQQQLDDMIGCGCSLSEIEDMFAYELGLEMDYFEAFI